MISNILLIVVGIIIYNLRKNYKNIKTEYDMERHRWVENAKLVTVGSKWEVKLSTESPFIPIPYGIVKEIKKDNNNILWVKISLYTDKGNYMHDEAIRLCYSYEPQFFNRFKYKV